MARLLSIMVALLFPVLVACGSDAPADDAVGDAGVVRMSAAVLSYNHEQAYVDAVHTAATAYAERSGG